ncbi:MAG: serine/threonine protein phosphatase, partial [Selenomonadaceae bacterium]|nr:serine/threonine protein phosphatase [Selenomonadaceae bacterium]
MDTQKFFIDDAAEIIPPVNDTPYKRIIAVGDVHGKFGKLMSLWSKLNVNDRDLLIFVGDYVDRGEGVAETLQWVLEMRRRKNFVFLRGNHEQMLLNAFSGDERDFTDK